MPLTSEQKILLQYENEIIKFVDEQQSGLEQYFMPNGDLQGYLEAFVLRVYREGQKTGVK